MKLAIVERIASFKNDDPFNEKYYLVNQFKKIFDDLDVLLIPVVSEKHLSEICQMCDGLVLTGSGNDVYPEYYNEDRIKEKEYFYDEYPLVKNITKLFADEHKPIIGICAGMQELNVIFGGTLNQRIENHKLLDHSKHRVKIAEDSFLNQVYNKEEIEVNSYHMQSVKDVAPGFKVTAISSKDGIIEAIEKDNIIGVQWHPEVLYDIKLFESFVGKYLNK